MHDTSINTIPRDHPIAQAVLADAPTAWLVWAQVIAQRRLMLDYIYLSDYLTPGGSGAFYDFGPHAADVVEASWSPDDHGPWQRHDPHEDTWKLQIEEP